MTEQLLRTAIHEAGHVVATLMLGYTIAGVSVEPGVTRPNIPAPRKFRYSAQLRGRVELPETEQEAERARYAADLAFISYGGPWATARLDGVEMAADDSTDYERYADTPSEILAGWSQQLEKQWSAIKLAGRRLYLGHMDYRRRQADRQRLRRLIDW
ncbi:hypothetical protein [Mycobacterium sp. pW045]|uniref:hypothetical protein n=1 Tax=Mycobacterium sp. pW045 TaxID=3238984 RepID=UPI00351BC0CE